MRRQNETRNRQGGGKFVECGAAAVSVDGRRGWIVTAAAAIGLLVSAPSIWLFTSGVFLLPLSAELQVSRGQMAAALAMFPLCVALAAPAAGYLVDRAGGPLVASVSVLLFAIGLTCIAFAPAHYAAFAAIVAFAGLISAGQTAIPYCRVVGGWFDRRRGLALSVALTGVGIGAAVFPLVAQHMIAAHGWRAAMLSIAAAAAVIAFPAVALLLRDPPKGKGGAAGVAPTSGMTRTQAFRDRQFWLIAAAFILIGCGTAGVPVHFPALLQDRGVAPGPAAALLSAIGVSLIFGRLFTGWLLDRMHAGRVESSYSRCRPPASLCWRPRPARRSCCLAPSPLGSPPARNTTSWRFWSRGISASVTSARCSGR